MKGIAPPNIRQAITNKASIKGYVPNKTRRIGNINWIVVDLGKDIDVTTIQTHRIFTCPSPDDRTIVAITKAQQPSVFIKHASRKASSWRPTSWPWWVLTRAYRATQVVELLGIASDLRGLAEGLLVVGGVVTLEDFG